MNKKEYKCPYPKHAKYEYVINTIDSESYEYKCPLCGEVTGYYKQDDTGRWVGFFQFQNIHEQKS